MSATLQYGLWSGAVKKSTDTEDVVSNGYMPNDPWPATIHVVRRPSGAKDITTCNEPGAVEYVRADHYNELIDSLALSRGEKQ